MDEHVCEQSPQMGDELIGYRWHFDEGHYDMPVDIEQHQNDPCESQQQKDRYVDIDEFQQYGALPELLFQLSIIESATAYSFLFPITNQEEAEEHAA